MTHAEKLEAYEEAKAERYAIVVIQPDVSEAEARRIARETGKRVWAELKAID